MIADSSSLILLAKISILDRLLSHLKEPVTITLVIFNECTAKKGAMDAELIKKRIKEGIILQRTLKSSNLSRKLEKDFNLGHGEAQAIQLCVEQELGLLTDDKRTLQTCKILGIPFTTALNLVVQLYPRGILKKDETETYINKLKISGRYSTEVINKSKEELHHDPNE